MEGCNYLFWVRRPLVWFLWLNGLGGGGRLNLSCLLVIWWWSINEMEMINSINESESESGTREGQEWSMRILRCFVVETKDSRWSLLDLRPNPRWIKIVLYHRVGTCRETEENYTNTTKWMNDCLDPLRASWIRTRSNRSLERVSRYCTVCTVWDDIYIIKL